MCSFKNIVLASVVSFNLGFSEESSDSSNITINEKCYDDDATSKLVTIITTTNPIPSIPEVKNHLYPTQKSLFQIPAFAKCKKIIVFDGLQNGFEQREEDYEKYKNNVLHLTLTDPYFSNTKLVFCENWVHLSGALKEAVKYVETPYIFIHQHDFILTKSFDLNGLIASMEVNPNIRHVRLNQSKPNTAIDWWDGPVDEVIDGPHFVPLCRNFGWSDNDHVATLSYYNDFVLPKCLGHGPMEAFLQSSMCETIRDKGYDIAQKEFGTYLYGDINDGGYILHTNGREDK